MPKKQLSIMLVALLVFLLASPLAVGAEETVTITVLGTSDLHGRLTGWDYAIDAADNDAGLGVVGTAVSQVRAETDNVILIDAGDTIQDNMADLFKEEEIHPMIQAMNTLGYDSWTLGNHEFNYGLDYLNSAISGFNGASLSGNIYKEDGTSFVQPYIVKEVGGVKVGILGMTTPHITRWEASNPEHFAGLVFNDPITETAKWVKVLQEDEQVDVIVGAYHMGMHPEYNYPGSGLEAVLEANPEITAVVAGHSHAKFAGELINGVLVSEPGRYGNVVARIDITLIKDGDSWTVDSKTSENISTKGLEDDSDVKATIAAYHQKARDYVNTPIGTATGDFVSPDEVPGIPTAQIADTPLVDLINEVQLEYTGADVSLAALFSSRSNIKEGPVSVKDAALIYKYDNTLIKTKLTGKQLKNMMEWSAAYYNTYQAGDMTVSFNPNIRGYNYDMFAGVDYKVDVSKEPGNRIVELNYQGQPLTDDTELTLALNNYRYGSMVEDGYLNAEDKLWDSYEAMMDEGRIRSLIIKYVQEQETIVPSTDNNWKITGANFNHPYRPAIIEMVRNEELTLPTSEDGRTPNVRALNVYTLIEQGKLPAPYEVESGDVLWQIAKDNGTTWEKLAEFNSMDNPHLIYPGDEVYLPVIGE